ncbi:universal stress protein [Nonomuraea maritima]|uniref:universal stress protein n=1 Tax=Nonomuraea maritima TaxID=683260 RepID=UPI003723017C
MGVDGSEAARVALGWAAEDAARRRLPLRLVHVREPWAAETEPTARSGRVTMVEWRAELLAESAARARVLAPGIDVSTAVATGAVVERLRTEGETADTLVVGGRGLGRLHGLALGSVTLGLAGHTDSPLVVVRMLPQRERGEVVVGYDGSPDADTAMAYGQQQALARSALLRVLHCSRYPALSPHPVGYGPVPAPHPDDVGARLALWQEKAPEVEMVESLVPGSAVGALIEASRAADLVVVGSRGRTGVASAVLGSVSHGVLRRARCPVAVVRARQGT